MFLGNFQYKLRLQHWEMVNTTLSYFFMLVEESINIENWLDPPSETAGLESDHTLSGNKYLKFIDESCPKNLEIFGIMHAYFSVSYE